MYHTVCFPLCYFNSRSRVWNDTFNLHESLCVDISIHVPAWGTTLVDIYAILSRDFNPRSPWGTTICLTENGRSFSISIHVPAWGTTGRYADEMAIAMISIHVPAWGTTLLKGVIEPVIGISIHVPAWGTTT